MTDEQLVPEIKRVVEDLFLRWGSKFPNVTIFPDHSIRGSSAMLITMIQPVGTAPSYLDPVRVAVATLPAKRVVFVSEGRIAGDEGTDTPRLRADHTEVPCAMFLHAGQARHLRIIWRISSTETVRTLDAPVAEPQCVLADPDLVL
jgi:hypothetical protein